MKKCYEKKDMFFSGWAKIRLFIAFTTSAIKQKILTLRYFCLFKLENRKNWYFPL